MFTLEEFKIKNDHIKLMLPDVLHAEDLHNINKANKHAEIGYWISQSSQAREIITECVNKISSIAFNELKLHKLSILVESENMKSSAVAKRVGFQYEATLKEHKLYKNSFKDKDYLAFSKFSNK